ncbi:MAG: membrane integrity-associated transporter subunit PqiC [Opitutales bacterium]|nr:membrane integrity-associated transporter subunit PqiC [Opitutales bacterium]MCH8540554.1 PqiC family protein [Opitutales bacterium]
MLHSPSEAELQEDSFSDEEGAWYVRPVRLPDYHQGNRIFYYSQDDGVVYVERDFWAEPFRDGVGRVLATEFAQRTGQMVNYYPASRKKSEDGEFLLSFSRLDPVENRGVVVDVMVTRSIPGEESGEETWRKRFRFTHGEGKYTQAGDIVGEIEAALVELARRVVE